WLNRFGDHCPRPDERILPYLIATHYGGVAAYGGSVPDHCGHVLVAPDDGAAGVDYVGEYHRRSQEYIILTYNSGIDRYIVLYLDIISENHTRRDHHVLAYIAVRTYDGVFHDMAEV